VLAQRAAATARVALIVTGILIANDATVVGVVDDVLIPVTVAIAGTAYVVKVVAGNTNPDVGPTASYPAVPPPDPENDPHTLSPNCKPNDAAVIAAQETAGTAVGDSRKLGRNMIRAGCAKPVGTSPEAHHIVAKARKTQAAIRARELLRDYGVDVDEAANGVWLPKSANPSVTRAMRHSTMHNETLDQHIFDRLKAAADIGGQPGIRQALAQIRGEMLNGTFGPKV
jgi:hypothetical protein